MDYALSSLAADWNWQALVYRYAVHDPAPAFLRDAKAGKDLAFPWAHWPGGVIVALGADTAGELKPTRVYDPSVDVEALLTDATTVDVTSATDLVRFVDQWGLLGLVSPPDEVPLWDSVLATAAHLKKVRGYVDRLDALKREQWTSPVLPSATALRRQIRGLPRSLGPRERARAQWQAFAMDLNQALRGCPLVPVLVADGSALGIRQTLRPQRLADLLLVALWQRATDADFVMRRCSTCGGTFFVSVSNHKRKFCTTRCKNLGGVRRWRKRQADEGGR